LICTAVAALKALYNGWMQHPSWDNSTDPCNDQWLGIWCNNDQTRVTGLYEIQTFVCHFFAFAVLLQFLEFEVGFSEIGFGIEKLVMN
jgi:hypothetical protein